MSGLHLFLNLKRVMWPLAIRMDCHHALAWLMLLENLPLTSLHWLQSWIAPRGVHFINLELKVIFNIYLSAFPAGWPKAPCRDTHRDTGRWPRGSSPTTPTLRWPWRPRWWVLNITPKLSDKDHLSGICGLQFDCWTLVPKVSTSLAWHALSWWKLYSYIYIYIYIVRMS